MQLLLFGWLPLISAAASTSRLRNGIISAVDVSEHELRQGTDIHPVEVVIQLTNYRGMEYAGPITVGGQSLQAIFDTGSYDLMTVSDHCSVCRMPKNMSVYKNGSSKSFKKGKSAETFHHYFAGGEIVARLDSDTVQIGSKAPFAVATETPIWQVTHTTLPQWTKPELCKFSTIVGLGFGATAPDSPPPLSPVVQLLERAGTSHFAICLQKGKSNPGFITLNPKFDLASPAFTSTFRRIPVIGHNHWALQQNSISYFNGQYTDSRCGGSQKCVAVVDSGTSLIGVPGIHMAFISEFAAKINNDCSNLDQLPDLNFDLGGQVFPLPASAYVLQLDGKCYAAFMQLSMASEHGLVWVLGLPFLRHYYTVWDRKAPALHIAEQDNDCKPKPMSAAVKLASTQKHVSTHFEPTIGDIREARLPSWAPKEHGTIEI